MMQARRVENANGPAATMSPMSATLQPREVSLDPAVPLVEDLHPAPDPWDLARRLAGRSHLLFFDSALSHPTLGRCSFVTADPFEWLESRGNSVLVSGEPPASTQGLADPFAVLAERLARFHVEPHPGLPPFQGGAAGLFGYDLCHHIERLPRPRFNEFETPDLAVGLYDWVVACDHAAGRAWLISTGLPETDPRRRGQRARTRLREICRLLH